jgi:hypothetical protein
VFETETDRADKSAQPGGVIGVLEAFRMVVAGLGAGLGGSVSRRGWFAAEAVEIGIVPVGEVGQGAELQQVEYVGVEERFLENVSIWS